MQCAPPTVDPADANVIRSSAVYATIGYIPQKFAYREPAASLVCAAEVREIKWSLPGASGGSLDISRGISQVPFDVRMPPDASWFTVEFGDVDGIPAVFAKNKPGQHGTQTLYLAEGNITTIIDASVDDYGEVIQIARSLSR